MRVARPLRHVAVARASARPMSEIPIKTCCRVVSMNVGDEATAIKMDGLVAKLKPVLEAVPGFAGLDRKVCKSEWDYATTMKFDSLDALKGYWNGVETKTSNLSSSVKSKSIRLIFGRIDCPRRVLEAQQKSVRRNGRICPH